MPCSFLAQARKVDEADPGHSQPRSRFPPCRGGVVRCTEEFGGREVLNSLPEFTILLPPNRPAPDQMWRPPEISVTVPVR
ncbi:hypothetical protein SAMN04489752_0114 [Brevibacterium siliguriense]|uniref:Uncharacterized protein n=1 Tax=Brevibacterium siliguriense TaxID=1136497 RepID=A0A1H1LI44_9MICO|nr:hypothetical protein SAMN04489752_0114 [Brevibacterium siliguriense]